jgi:hypothetical protein
VDLGRSAQRLTLRPNGAVARLGATLYGNGSRRSQLVAVEAERRLAERWDRQQAEIDTLERILSLHEDKLNSIYARHPELAPTPTELETSRAQEAAALGCGCGSQNNLGVGIPTPAMSTEAAQAPVSQCTILRLSARSAETANGLSRLRGAAGCHSNPDGRH